MFIVRQGDVLIKSCAEIPAEHEKIKPDNGRVVLAYGEVTGHAHAINAKNAMMVKANNKVFLRIIKQAELVHEEHETINLPIGNYEVIQQREYTPEGIRNVAD